MKKSVYVHFLLLTVLIISLQGCIKETTPGPDSTDTRVKFLGRWSVIENWQKSAYQVTISADPNSTNGIFIQNFANAGTSGNPAAASISGNNITLDYNQEIGDGWIINGSGSYQTETGKIIWNYTLNDGATLITATATYTKL